MFELTNDGLFVRIEWQQTHNAIGINSELYTFVYKCANNRGGGTLALSR